MRIGIVAYWFNRGQAVVARQIRATLQELGHETFVLARPTRKTNIKPGWIDTEGVWDQEGVTAASDYLIPWSEYEAWAREAELELVMFDQNYQFGEIARLREMGVRTVGRFVWEHFAAEHVEAAKRAFETVYSLTACELGRYAELGIETPRVRWGCAPELVALGEEMEGAGGGVAPAPGQRSPAPGASRFASRWSPRGRAPLPGGLPAEGGGGGGLGSGRVEGSGRDGIDRDGEVVLLFPGGFMSKRKPLGEAIMAFRGTSDRRLRLILKAQVERQRKRVLRLARGGRIGRRDRRIELITADLPHDEYLRMLGSADACLAPSRWEGLGLHLFEATALGVPIVTNDNPPMNEIVRDGDNGLLVPGIPDGTARSGVPAFRPDVDALRDAIERLTDPELRATLAAGARRRREELSWDHTRADLQRLIHP